MSKSNKPRSLSNLSLPLVKTQYSESNLCLGFGMYMNGEGAATTQRHVYTSIIL